MSVAMLYTNTASIRAAIGVSELEVDDQTFVDCNTVKELTLYFNRVFPGHLVLKDLIDNGAPTDADRARYMALELTCMYAGAWIALRANQNRFEQLFTSGGTSKSRFSKDDIQTLPDRMAAARDGFLDDVLGNPPILVTDMMGGLKVVSPLYDPVTGV